MSVSPVAVSYEPGKYPSKLDWSLLGLVLGFIYCTRARTDQAMLLLSSNGKRGAGLQVTSNEWQKVHLSRAQSGNEKKRSLTQPLGQRAMTS